MEVMALEPELIIQVEEVTILVDQDQIIQGQDQDQIAQADQEVLVFQMYLWPDYGSQVLMIMLVVLIISIFHARKTVTTLAQPVTLVRATIHCFRDIFFFP